MDRVFRVIPACTCRHHRGTTTTPVLSKLISFALLMFFALTRQTYAHIEIFARARSSLSLLVQQHEHTRSSADSDFRLKNEWYHATVAFPSFEGTADRFCANHNYQVLHSSSSGGVLLLLPLLLC